MYTTVSDLPAVIEVSMCLMRDIGISESYMYGEDEHFSTEYYWTLMEHGIMRKEAKQFEKETEVHREAVEILGEELHQQNQESP